MSSQNVPSCNEIISFLRLFLFVVQARFCMLWYSEEILVAATWPWEFSGSNFGNPSKYRSAASCHNCSFHGVSHYKESLSHRPPHHPHCIGFPVKHSFGPSISCSNSKFRFDIDPALSSSPNSEVQPQWLFSCCVFVTKATYKCQLLDCHRCYFSLLKTSKEEYRQAVNKPLGPFRKGNFPLLDQNSSSSSWSCLRCLARTTVGRWM